MLPSISQIPLIRLVYLFGAVFILGSIATLPVYGFSWQRFRMSEVFIKILVWIPIFGVFVGFLYAPPQLRFAGLLIIIALVARELFGFMKVDSHRFVTGYAVVISISLLHFAWTAQAFPGHMSALLIIIFVSSVMSDVAAFFAGKYAGRHKLPAALNSGKSWEGVAGQFIGAGIGVLVVRLTLIDHVSWWFALAAGLGSACGDLSNSYVKRRLNIKDWSKALPGHGGVTDRMSSLAGAGVATFYLALVFSIR